MDEMNAIQDATAALNLTEATAMSPLERLPLEVSQEIYKWLLHADNVRQEPDTNMVCSYHFETAILAVSKQVHNAARPCLYHDNDFVQVSCNGEHIFRNMVAEQVAAIACTKPHLMARFKEHILRLHIDIPWSYLVPGNKKQGPVLESFLLLSNELPRFVHMLQHDNLYYSEFSYKLKFRIEGNSAGLPSIVHQRHVLEPFRCLTVGPTRLLISGAVDGEYAASLKDNMISSVQWVRAVKWQAYHLGISAVGVADEAFRIGCRIQDESRYEYWKTAARIYTMARDTVVRALRTNPQLAIWDYDGFGESWFALASMANVNLGFIKLRLGDWAGALRGLDLSGPGFSHQDALRSIPLPLSIDIWLARGIAYAGLEYFNAAGNQFAKAANMQSYKGLGQHLADSYNEHLGDSTKLREICSSREVLDYFHEPHPLHRGPCYIASKCIANERHLLRHFGYRGSLMPEIEKEGRSSKKQLKKEVKRLETLMKEKQEAGKGPGVVWIGEAASSIVI